MYFRPESCSRDHVGNEMESLELWCWDKSGQVASSCLQRQLATGRLLCRLAILT